MFTNREAVGGSPRRELAIDCLAAGIAAAHPDDVVSRKLAFDDGTLRVDGTAYDLDAYERVLVVGGGKAAGAMAAAVEDLLGDAIDDGVVVTDSPTTTRAIRQFRGNHPLPDQGGLEGSRAVRNLTDSADEGTLILALLTGGGSALLPAPAGDISLEDLRHVTGSLTAAGAPIEELNTVRKHLSTIKGGRLATRASPARVVGLIISDVVGDELGTIASGPLAPDPSTFADARAVLDRYEVEMPAAITRRLEQGIRGAVEETPRAENSAFERVSLHVLASSETAVEAAKTVAEERGVATAVHSTSVEGEAQAVGRTEAALARRIEESGEPVAPPCVLLSAGETTVTVTGDGRGGPNQEVALAGALELAATNPVDVTIASIDTDGRDGNSSAAGAILDTTTVENASAARRALAEHDVTPYLAARDALLETGVTGTNVNDLRVFVIGEDLPP